MSKFTEAPWKIDCYNDVYSEPADYYVVATTYFPDDEEEIKANARLIAAAPEMYELLKEEIIPTSDYGGTVSFARERKVRELLARIDGINLA